MKAMKSIKFILAISLPALCAAISPLHACGPYFPENPAHLHFFRCCSPALEQQWQDGCRFQDYEKDENCMLWQKITSPYIPVKDIEKVVYDARLGDLRNLNDGPLSENRFAMWLTQKAHREDLEYLLVAKEIEEVREYMNDPWYYAYDGDEEHQRLDELMRRCEAYKGRRHAARYALQMARLHFARKDFRSCIELWESSVSSMPRDIVTDMIASYAGGAYSREGNRDKAIELFTRSQDIGSLISLKVWNTQEAKSVYKDPRMRELEYIFNRFPNSPLLSVRLQEYLRDSEYYLYDICEDRKGWDISEPNRIAADSDGYPASVRKFYDELKRFGDSVTRSKECRQKGMWHYALAYLYYLEGDMGKVATHLPLAESSESTPFIGESIRAFRILVDATHATDTPAYRSRLLTDLKWLDERMQRDAALTPQMKWQYANKMNYSFYYWQDVARKVLLGEVCPRMDKAGNATLALQLANYATNRVHQIAKMLSVYYMDGYNFHTKVITFDEYRTKWSGRNYYDYSNQFFEWIEGSSAEEAAKYVGTIENPGCEVDRFLNERGYVDHDYLCDIVGTLYLREMDYVKASKWLAKVSTDYQGRTNIAKAGYFRLDPFRFQTDKKHFIADSTDYKLRFAQEMVRLEQLMSSDAEPNRRANATIRFATGLRNSFGRCWYLTGYGFNMDGYFDDNDWRSWCWYTSCERESFEESRFARKAYERGDALMERALSEFTEPEQAARAHLEMKNFSTLMSRYPETEAAEFVRGHCDSYYDYGLQRL